MYGVNVGCALEEWVDPEFKKRSIVVINELKQRNDKLEVENEAVIRDASYKDSETEVLSVELQAAKEDNLMLRKRLRELDDLLSVAKTNCMLV